jgi:hypothetical protein
LKSSKKRENVVIEIQCVNIGREWQGGSRWSGCQDKKHSSVMKWMYYKGKIKINNFL